jgi:hypothetical protein
VLARGRAARASDLGATDDLDEDAVTALEARVDDALLPAALAALAQPRTGLLAAAALGVPGAVPHVDPARWPAQIDAVRTTLATRIARLAAVAAATTLPARHARTLERIAAIFGDGFRIAPPFVANVPALANSFDDLDAGDPDATGAWLTRVALVREGAAALDRALVYADCIAPGARDLAIAIAQLPFVTGDAWIGGDAFHGEPPAGRHAYAVHAPHGLDVRGGRVAGLLVDAWSEVVPSTQRTTAIALHVEQPSAAPPQAIVLAIPPDDSTTWTDDVVEAVVRETLELAKLRLVDTDALREVGHYLPALYFAVNTPADEHALADTASTDFTGVL